MSGWQDVKASIFPYLKKRIVVNEASSLFCIDWIKEQDICIYFVLDDGLQLRHISALDMKQWGVRPNQLVEVASSNLMDDDKIYQLSSAETGGELFLSFEHGDGYDTTRIISKYIRKVACSNLNSKTCTLFMPHRDLALFCAKPNNQILAYIQCQYKDSNHKLSPNQFIVNEYGDIVNCKELFNIETGE